MSRRKCCCEGCEILLDDFNREDSTNVGGKWVELDTVWEIDTNRLSATSAGVIRTSRSHPVDDPTGYITVDIPDIQAGDKYYVIIDYKYDELTSSETYLWGAYYWSGTGNAELSVGTTTDGVDTVWETAEVTVQSDGQDPPTYYDTMKLCRSVDGIYCGVTSDYPTAWECGLGDNGGRKAGLRAGSLGGSSLVFDNFSWQQHYHTNHDCPLCNCDCEEYCVPPYMQMTFVAVDEDNNPTCEPCGALNGVNSISTKVTNAVDKEYQFVFDNTLPYGIPTGCYLDNNQYSFRLQCPRSLTNSCDGWILGFGGDTTTWHTHDDHQPGDCSWDTSDEVLPCECTCSPLILKYGPFWMTTESGNCVYYIHLTPYYPP